VCIATVVDLESGDGMRLVHLLQAAMLRLKQAVMLRLGLNAGNVYPKLAEHMGAFCARTLYNTSLLALSSTQHRWGAMCRHGLCGCTLHLQCTLAQFCITPRAKSTWYLLQHVARDTSQRHARICCRELVGHFANDEMCRITEALIFQEPYSAAEAKNKWTSPHLDSDVKALQADEDARAAAGRLQVSSTA
jgi:5-methylthioribose kinase